VKSWRRFKQLIAEHKPSGIVYNIERGVPAGHLKGLRLILPAKGVQYVFVDTAAENCLRKTGIPLREDGLGSVYIKEEDILSFVRSETGRSDLAFHSYWTI
jgi:hypothetical protein